MKKIKHKKRIHHPRLTMKHKEKRLEYACQYQIMSVKKWRKEIQFRWSQWLSEVLACKYFS